MVNSLFNSENWTLKIKCDNIHVYTYSQTHHTPTLCVSEGRGSVLKPVSLHQDALNALCLHMS